MGKSLTYEYVKDFVKDNSECKLLSTFYTSTVTLMDFECKCGNAFKTTFGDFKSHNKRQCNNCGNERTGRNQRYSKEDIKNIVESTSTCKLISCDEYKNIYSKILLKCSCGREFTKSLSNFTQSQIKLCRVCSRDKYSYDFVKEFIESKHCKLISTEYIGYDNPIQIECKCGRPYKTTFKLFTRRCECGVCTGNKLSIEYCKEKTKEISNCELIESEYINNSMPMNFRCECGNIYEVSWDKFTSHNQIRCSSCTKNKSKGEYAIENFLKDNKIKYKTQYTFQDCINVTYLRFDFAILNEDDTLKFLIEFDGSQHYSSSGRLYTEQKVIYIKTNDKIKNSYCESNNIRLVRIPYWKLKNINNLLNNIFKGDKNNE